ncbi:hypothetical protein [Fluviicola sp.]|uniref:hypothetical protein n=1 Tax=Fluviicola sp. TaxID=1917219 RepID=UPI0031D1DC0C
MKNLIIGLVFAMGTFWVSAQSSASQANTPSFFAQCLVNVGNQNELTTLENQLRTIPYVKVVRVDIPTSRLFLTTKDLSSFTATEFSSWMGTYATSYSCLQIGLHGVDPVNPFPFTNCQD